MRRPEHQIVSEEETLTVLGSWAQKDDRGTALSAAAHVEDRLGTAIKVRFVPLSAQGDVRKCLTEAALFDGYGPLASFFPKIDIGFALGLYGAKTRSDLHTIRSIRNAFAHSIEDITFRDAEIIQKCQALGVRTEKRKTEDFQPKEQGKEHPIPINKLIYIAACS